MTTLKRKSYQRKINNIVRNINKMMEKDELWWGRFVVYQIRAKYHKYEDNSGISCHYCFCLYDKKTGIDKKVYMVDGNWLIYTNGYELLEELNKFIVEDLDVWRNEKPEEDNTDYTKIKMIRRR